MCGSSKDVFNSEHPKHKCLHKPHPLGCGGIYVSDISFTLKDKVGPEGIEPSLIFRI